MAEPWVVTSAHSSVSLSYESENGLMYVKWTGHIATDDVISVAKQYLNVQQQYRCPKLLNDKSEVTGSWDEANDWLEYEWLPQVKGTGLKHFALVLSRDLHDLATAQDLQQRLSKHCNAALFRELASAREWLNEQPA